MKNLGCLIFLCIFLIKILDQAEAEKKINATDSEDHDDYSDYDDDAGDLASEEEETSEKQSSSKSNVVLKRRKREIVMNWVRRRFKPRGKPISTRRRWWGR